MGLGTQQLLERSFHFACISGATRNLNGEERYRLPDLVRKALKRLRRWPYRSNAGLKMNQLSAPRIVKHEAIPGGGSFELRFPDDRPSQYFYSCRDAGSGRKRWIVRYCAGAGKGACKGNRDLLISKSLAPESLVQSLRQVVDGRNLPRLPSALGPPLKARNGATESVLEVLTDREREIMRLVSEVDPGNRTKR